MISSSKKDNQNSLTNEKLVEQSKYLITRYDSYFNQINIKSNFLLVFNTFICTSVLVIYENVLKDMVSDYSRVAFLLCLIILFVVAIIAIGILMRTAFPFLKPSSSIDENTSLIFYGSVAERPFSAFQLEFQNLTSEVLLNDYKSQIHILATGLTGKYRNLRIVGFCILIEVVIILIAFVSLIINKY